MSDDLVKRWDEYVDSMGSVMGEVEHMAQQMRDRIEELEVKLQDAEQRGYANAMEAERTLHENRIEELEAKLAKAVEALQFYRSAVNLRIDCEITHAMQEAHTHAEAFIAKIKGEQP